MNIYSCTVLYMAKLQSYLVQLIATLQIDKPSTFLSSRFNYSILEAFRLIVHLRFFCACGTTYCLRPLVLVSKLVLVLMAKIILK
jgi:hypothetical protein